VDVCTRRLPRGIEIIVPDNGPKVAVEVMDKLRKPLFTVRGFGIGLGLCVVEKIME